MTRPELVERFKAPLLGLIALTLGACAAQEADTSQGNCNPKSVGCNIAPAAGASSTGGGNNGTSGGSSTGGDTSGGGAGNGTSGSTSSGGAVDLGGAGMASTVGGASGATANGGSSGTGVVTAGAGAAAAGAPSGGAPSGGAPSGGATGSAGAGGATNALCTTAIPARTSWTATASAFSNACTTPTDALCNPPSYAIDGDPSTRFSTGTKQVGTEWLQIDLGASGTVDQVTLSVSNNDYGRHIQIRMSNTSNDNAAPILIEQDGVTGLQTFKFSAPKTARYILISQTGMLMTGETSWWSVQEATVSCN